MAGRWIPRIWLLSIVAVPGLALQGGCAEEEAPPPPSGSGGAGVGTLGSSAGGGGGGLADGAIPGDGGSPRCTFTPLVLLDDPQGEALDLSLAGGSEGHLAVYTETRSGQSDTFARIVPDVGEAGAEIALTDDGFESRSPAAVGTSGGWVALWSDDELAGFEIRSRSVSSTGAVGALTEQLTLNGIDDDLPSALALSGTQALVLWLGTDLSTSQAFRAAIDNTGAPVVVADSVSAAGVVDGPPEVVGVGLSADPAVAWVDSMGDLGFLFLTTTGQAIGSRLTPVTGGDLTDFYDATGSMAGALVAYERDLGSAVALEAVALDVNGEAIGEPTALNDETAQAFSPSVVSFGDGYALLYRRSDSGGATARLALLASDGRVRLDARVASVASATLPTALSVDDEGDLLLSWGDSSGSGVRIDAARARCEG